ncbi:MAG TPA: rRNA adenine N-6-methyltransferase family protein [Fodinibius sp.]|nr:rRNA adenine N-6-methyltransferase family protein [Fodinibius sp.]
MTKPTVRPFKHLLYFFKDLKQTGSIAPSSKFLAKDLVAQLKRDIDTGQCKPLKVLEIGPGTGPLTKQIIKHLRPNDSLDIVEIHKKFYQIVRDRYRQPNLQVHHTNILNFTPDYKYDFIFSSLPYENMDEDICRKIWQKKLRLCSKNACISYFKYVKFKNFKNDFEEEIVKAYGRDKKVVLLNLPPAKVYTLEVSHREKDGSLAVAEKSNVA